MSKALVLAGGGARGAFQVGMLEELVINQGIDFEIIRGVSVGALNAAFLAQAPTQGDSLQNLQNSVGTLREIWDGIKGNHSVYSERSGLAGLALGADSIYSLKPLENLIEENLDVDVLRTSGRNFEVGTVSLMSGLYNLWKPSEKDFVKKLKASASIPVVFPYVDFEDEDVLVDGGVRNITPLSSAFRAKPDEIYVLLTSRVGRDGNDLYPSGVKEHDYEQWDDNWLGTKVSGFDVLKRTVEILTDEVYLDDIRSALHWNDVAKAVDDLSRAAQSNPASGEVNTAIERLKEAMGKVKKRNVKLNVIARLEWYGDTNSSTEFSPNLISWAIKHGKEVAADKELWVWPPPEGGEGIV